LSAFELEHPLSMRVGRIGFLRLSGQVLTCPKVGTSSRKLCHKRDLLAVRLGLRRSSQSHQSPSGRGEIQAVDPFYFGHLFGGE